MTTPAERQRSRDRAADGQATRDEVIIRKTEWWPNPVSNLTRAQQAAARRARKRAAEVTA